MSWPRELPEGSHLAYACLHEIRLANSAPEISVSASMRGNGGGGRWEFGVKEFDLGGPCIRVHVYDESFAAFTELPEFFARLAAEEIDTIAGVLVLLNKLGAVDETPRVAPSAPRRERLKVGIVDRLDGCDIALADRGPIADMVLDLLGETTDD
jgi:hypothetical protein